MTLWREQNTFVTEEFFHALLETTFNLAPHLSWGPCQGSKLGPGWPLGALERQKRGLLAFVKSPAEPETKKHWDDLLKKESKMSAHCNSNYQPKPSLSALHGVCYVTIRIQWVVFTGDFKASVSEDFSGLAGGFAFCPATKVESS